MRLLNIKNLLAMWKGIEFFKEFENIFDKRVIKNSNSFLTL